MRIIYTREAKQDLAALREYYEPRSSISMQHIVGDIISVVDDLPMSLSKGRRTPHPDVWEKVTPKYKYLIPYFVHDGSLFILRVYAPGRKPLKYHSILKLDE